MAQIGESPVIGCRRNLNRHKYCSTPERSASCTDLVLKDRINNFNHPSHSTNGHSKSVNESPRLPSRFKIFSDKENIPFKENNFQIRKRSKKFSGFDTTETKSPAIGRKLRNACTLRKNPISLSVNNKSNIPSFDNEVQLSNASSIENTEQTLNISSCRRSSRLACKTQQSEPKKVFESRTELKKVLVPSEPKTEPKKLSESKTEPKKVSESKIESKKVSESKTEPKKISKSKIESKKLSEFKTEPKKVSDSKHDIQNFKTPVRKALKPVRKKLPPNNTCSRSNRNEKAGNSSCASTNNSADHHPKRRSTRVANKNSTLTTADLSQNKKSLDSGFSQNISVNNNTPSYSKKKSTSGIPSTSSCSNRKPPWKKNKFETPLFDFKLRRKSGRLSSIQKKDVYDFPNEENSENNKKKKVKRKAPCRRKRKALKPSIKPSLLTTDPSFPSILPNLAISSQSFYGRKKYKQCKSPRPLNLNEPNDEDESHDHGDTMESNCEDIPIDDDGYEASISISNNTTERSTFSSLHPVGSQTSVPTPDVNARFPGTSSTPRHETDNSSLFNPFAGNVASSNPPTVLDDLQLCFGFDEPEDQGYIGLSPVKKAPQLSQLHAASIVTHSNVEAIEPIPTRFNLPLPPLPPIKKHDRSYLKKDNKNSSYTRKRRLPKKVLEETPSNENESIDKQCINANKSVLFDLELEELQNNDENEINKKNNTTKELPPPKVVSPEKSFIQAPRRSYNRESLEALRQKFQANLAGGYPTTDTDTDIEPENCPPKRPKRKRAIKSQSDEATSEKNEKEKVALKTYSKKKKKGKENNFSHSDIEKRKGKSKETDKSLSDWVSDINSHFSEIEDVALAVE